jgi:hypothetical protein
MISGMMVRGETKLLGKTFSSVLEMKECETDHLYISALAHKHEPHSHMI